MTDRPEISMVQTAQKTKTPPVVGLAGGIAVGKTSVSSILAEKGALIIDADSVGHRVIAPEGEAFPEVVAEFGEDILAADGVIDRRKLGALVFADVERLRALNRISHPRMAELMAREIAAIRQRSVDSRPALILLDAAILFEAGWDSLCDEVWVVTSDRKIALERLMERNGLGREEAQSRLDAQMDETERAAKADRVIRNNGDLDALRAVVEKVWREAMAELKVSPAASPATC